MTRSPFRQVDVARLIRSAEAAGWPRGSYKVVVERERLSLVPIDAVGDEADDIARRIESMEGQDLH